MNIETKTVRGDVKEYTYFGWEHTEDARVGSGRHGHTEHVLARDKDMANYSLIKALESKYFALKSTKKTYTPMDGGLCLILFLMLILPGVIYVAFKLHQSSQIEEYNSSIDIKMSEILSEVKKLV